MLADYSDFGLGKSWSGLFLTQALYILDGRQKEELPMGENKRIDPLFFAVCSIIYVDYS